MFKMHLRNPKNNTMEVKLIETCAEAETLCLQAWPDCRVSALGEVIVDVTRHETDRHGMPIQRTVPYVVAKVEFQCKE